jgi:hypothetical protein
MKFAMMEDISSKNVLKFYSQRMAVHEIVSIKTLTVR